MIHASHVITFSVHQISVITLFANDFSENLAGCWAGWRAVADAYRHSKLCHVPLLATAAFHFFKRALA